MDAYVLQLLTFAVFGMTLSTSQFANQTIELVNDTLRNYDKSVRPTMNQSLPTNVSAFFYILNIEEFNEVEGRFSVSGVLNLGWRNELITWKPEDYGGIQSHMFSSRKVWYPELVMAYQTGKVDSYVKDWMTIRNNHDGWCGLGVISLFQSSCGVDITYYPFDTQECDILLVPIGYYEEEMYMEAQASYVGTGLLTEHGGWDLIGTSSTSLDGDGLLFTFRLKRKPLFFLVNIILPIMLMSVLSSLIFALPPQSGERVSYGITVLLAIAVFLTLVGDNLPKTSSPMSILSFYLMFNLGVSTLMCIAAILNLRLYFHEGDDQLPIWARCIVIATCTGKCTQRKDNGSKEMYKADSEAESRREREQRNATNWVDVSKAIDKLCIVSSLLVTVISNVVFVLVIANSGDNTGKK